MEMSAEISGIEYVIVGVGINVNTKARDLPADRCIYPASSMMIEAGERFARAAVLANWLKGLEYWVGELVENGGDRLIRAWEERSAAVGTHVKVSDASGDIEGCIIGLREDGALRLKQADGKEITVLSGDILVQG